MSGIGRDPMSTLQTVPIGQISERCFFVERRRLGLGGKAKTFANNMPRAMALAWIDSLYRLIKQICASTFYLKFYLNQTPRTPRDLQNRSCSSAIDICKVI